MRRGSEPKFLIEKDVFLGINLGSDFTAEHEWGIKDLNKIFGIPTEETEIDKLFGSIRYRINVVPNQYIFMNIEGDEAYLIVSSSVFYHADDYAKATVSSINKAPNNSHVKSELCFRSFFHEEYLAKKNKTKFVPPKNMLAAAWSESDFGIHVKGEEYIGYLKEIYEAITKKDLCLFIGSSRIFENGGLQLIIASRIPKEGEELLTECHTDSLLLKNTANQSGIRDRLNKAGKEFFALSPKWIKDIQTHSKTNYDIIFWLNPMQQDKYNSSYFTVEELEQWIKEEGPVVKNKILQKTE